MIDTKNWFQIQPIYSYLSQQAENQKVLKYLEITATFILIAIFLFAAVMPTITTISSLIGDIKSKEIFIQKADAKLNNFLKAQDSYSKFQERNYLLEESYPSMAHYYDGTTNLATIFKNSSLGINLININLEVKDTKSNLTLPNVYQVNISGEGQYSSILDMVKKLSNNRRLITPASIVLGQPTSANNNQSGSSIVQVNLNSNIFYLPSTNEKK